LPGSWIVNAGETEERHLRPKTTNYRLSAGDRLTVIVPGGGGQGEPRDRDPDLVARDVRAGIVSPGAALAIYGYDLGAR
jgi:N-methylhydantoinase B